MYYKNSNFDKYYKSVIEKERIIETIFGQIETSFLHLLGMTS